MRAAFLPHIPDEQELEEFGLWAFGPYYRELDESINFMETWNQLHGDKLKLERSGKISIDVPKMVQVWRDNK